MKTGYIGKPWSYFFIDKTGTKRHFTMIYGEEVQYAEPVSDAKRVEIDNRSRKGWVKSGDIMKDPVLETYHIDVGQGDSTFIVTPGRKKILIDGGANNQALKFLSWKYRLQDYKDNQKLLIDLVILSHADGDHVKGLTLLLNDKRIQVKEIMHNGIARFSSGFGTELGDKSPDKKHLITRHDKLMELDDNKLDKDFLEWKKAIIDNGNVDYHAVEANMKFDIDTNIGIEILGPRLVQSGNNQKAYPWIIDEGKTINGNSIIVKMTYDKVSFLYPGDVNPMGSEHIILDSNLKIKLDSHVLKAPHHGSHEYLQQFLAYVNPQITVISSGDDNTYGHPRANFIGDVGRVARQCPLIFATQIAGRFKDKDENLRERLDLSDDEWKNLDPASLEKLRKQFKRRLHGMINIRTDGKKIFAARRIKTPLGWEYYGDITLHSRSIP